MAAALIVKALCGPALGNADHFQIITDRAERLITAEAWRRTRRLATGTLLHALLRAFALKSVRCGIAARSS
jgi:hypothetical protein